MGNILESIADVIILMFITQQVIVSLFQILVHQMIPCSSIAVEHGRCLDLLLAVLITSLTMIRLVRFTNSCAVELEELPQVICTE